MFRSCMVLTLVLLSQSALPLSAKADPLARFQVGQHLSSARVSHLAGFWLATWHIEPRSKAFQVGIHLGDSVSGSIERDGHGRTAAALELHGFDREFIWSDYSKDCHQAASLDPLLEPCGVVRPRLESDASCTALRGESPFRVLTHFIHGYDEHGLTDGKPSCGPRMVEILENRDTHRAVTCVDRAYEGAQSLSILEIAIDSRGHPLWLVSPAPWGGDPYGTDYGATLDLDLDLPETCEPYASWFAPQPLSTTPKARANRVSGLTFEWDTDTPGDADLLSIQAWHDDRETGAFVLFHADLKPATLGYKIDGEPHGLWTYFGPDARLLEARIYVLGDFLMALPVRARTP